MSDQRAPGEPLVGEVRFRVPLPLIIPIGALVLIAALAIGFAKVLLSVPHEAATIIAIAMASNVLGVCAFMALRGRLGTATMMELGAILIYPVLIGIVLANINLEGGGEAAAEEGGGGGGGGGLSVTADNISFDTDLITVTAGEEAAIDFENADSVEHNIAVYPDEESGVAKSDATFTGDIIQGGQSITYDVPAVDAGEYYFQCDVHPNMNGAYVAE
jgi:plastocyanin